MAGSEDGALVAAAKKLADCAELLGDVLRLDAEKSGQTHTVFVADGIVRTLKAAKELREAIATANMQQRH